MTEITELEDKQAPLAETDQKIRILAVKKDIKILKVEPLPGVMSLRPHHSRCTLQIGDLIIGTNGEFRFISKFAQIHLSRKGALGWFDKSTVMGAITIATNDMDLFSSRINGIDFSVEQELINEGAAILFSDSHSRKLEDIVVMSTRRQRVRWIDGVQHPHPHSLVVDASGISQVASLRSIGYLTTRSVSRHFPHHDIWWDPRRKEALRLCNDFVITMFAKDPTVATQNLDGLDFIPLGAILYPDLLQSKVVSSGEVLGKPNDFSLLYDADELIKFQPFDPATCDDQRVLVADTASREHEASIKWYLPSQPEGAKIPILFAFDNLPDTLTLDFAG